MVHIICTLWKTVLFIRNIEIKHILGKVELSFVAEIIYVHLKQWLLAVCKRLFLLQKRTIRFYS